MKKASILFVLLAALSVGQFGVQKIVLENAVNLEEKMAKNNVFLKACRDFEMEPEKDLVYFLDRTFGTVFKVKISTGELLKTIGTRGQGPGEIQQGASLKVINDKIFVLDSGFNGIKIFDPEGKPINEFKIRSSLGSRRNIDVNHKNEIYVGKVDYQNNTMVSVYDVEGNKKRALIPFEGDPIKKKSRSKISRYYYYIKLDKDGNILVLYYMLRKLAKYSPEGKLTWEIDIKNEILDSFPKDDMVKNAGKSISKRWSVFNLATTRTNDIIVGHKGGGCLYGPDGKLKKLLVLKMKNVEEPGDSYNVNLGLFKTGKNILMNVLVFGRVVRYYDLKEELLWEVRN